VNERGRGGCNDNKRFSRLPKIYQRKRSRKKKKPRIDPVGQGIKLRSERGGHLCSSDSCCLGEKAWIAMKTGYGSLTGKEGESGERDGYNYECLNKKNP